MSNDFTLFERMKLAYLLRSSMSLRAIAKIMRRSHSILSREIRRNGGTRKQYQPDRAEALSVKRRYKKHRGKLDKHPLLKEFVLKKLSEDWSPEQIAGRLKTDPPVHLQGLQISHESIYHFLYERCTPEEKALVRHLRQTKKHRTRRGTRRSKSRIPERISIHERPKIVRERKRYGDWESDSVEGLRRTKTALSVQFERKSQLARLTKQQTISMVETNDALTRTAETVPPEWFKSVTFDNGKENYGHTKLKDRYNVQTYFCDPFASWQKGGVENLNKLIRQYIPKKTDISILTDRDIQAIENKLNNRPRKNLKYKTPNEVLQLWKSGALKT